MQSIIRRSIAVPRRLSPSRGAAWQNSTPPPPLRGLVDGCCRYDETRRLAPIKMRYFIGCWPARFSDDWGLQSCVSSNGSRRQRKDELSQSDRSRYPYFLDFAACRAKKRSVRCPRSCSLPRRLFYLYQQTCSTCSDMKETIE